MNLPPTVPYLQLSSDQLGVSPPYHTLPGTIRLGLLTLQIADLERSLEFYTRVIGFALLESGEEAGRRYAKLGLQNGGVLLELREKPGAFPALHRGRLGLYHFAVLLPTRAELGRFLNHAVGLGVHVGHSDHHYSEATYLQDPDGLSIEVYHDRPRDEWRVTGQGEIIGGIDPLEVESLKAAAGDTPWQGLPTGTILGHLHFYVGDLAKATRFYHEGLGFPKTTWSLPGALFLGAGGYHHHVGLNTWAAGTAPAGDNDARLLTWELILPDEATLRTTVESLTRAGFSSTQTAQGFLASDAWGITVLLRTA